MTARAFVSGPTARQEARFIVGEGEDIDDLQASGAWISIDSEHIVEAEP